MLYYPAPDGTFTDDAGVTTDIVTVEELIGALELRLNAEGEITAPPLKNPSLLLLGWLNSAQMWAVGMVLKQARELLSALEYSEAITLGGSGAVDLAALTYTPYRNWIDGVKLDGYPRFHRYILWSAYREDVDRGRTHNSTNPVCYRRGRTLTFDPGDSGDAGDIYYIREPARLILDDEDLDDNGDCELSRDLTPAIVEKAASYALAGNREEVLAQNAEARVIRVITDLKETSNPSDDFTHGLIATPRDIDRHSGSTFLRGE